MEAEGGGLEGSALDEGGLIPDRLILSSSKLISLSDN